MELYDLTKMLNSNCPSYFASTPNSHFFIPKVIIKLIKILRIAIIAVSRTNLQNLIFQRENHATSRLFQTGIKSTES